MGGTTGDFDNDKWELYNLAEDFSEANDLSAKYPQKLKELQDDFWVEAKKYNVLPLDDRFAERGDPSLRPSLIAGRTDFTYYPVRRGYRSRRRKYQKHVAHHHRHRRSATGRCGWSAGG